MTFGFSCTLPTGRRLGSTFVVMRIGGLAAVPSGRAGESVVWLINGPTLVRAALFTFRGVAVARYVGTGFSIASSTGSTSAREPFGVPCVSVSGVLPFEKFSI